jgi:peptidyl-prolyl cis-trans isomerase SurA
MTLKNLLKSAAFLLGLALAAGGARAQIDANAPESPYGGSTVEDIVARVNDQIITKSDYDRAQEELDQEGHQRGQTMQEMAASRRDLLRNLIDQQLWLSKAKELNVSGSMRFASNTISIRLKIWKRQQKSRMFPSRTSRPTSAIRSLPRK